MFDRTIAACAAALFLATTGHAQEAATPKYPSRPIKLVVGYSPGGSNDIVARLVARQLQDSLGQTVVVENKPSTAAIVGAVAVANAAPDGYTLMIGASGPIVINPALYSNLPYSPLRDFTPIAQIATFPLIVSVKADSKVSNIRELAAYTQGDPAHSNYASSSSTFQLATELLKDRTGVKAEHLPYKGSGESMNAVASGQATFSLLDPGPAAGAIKGKLIRGIAVTSAKRMSSYPDVPTLKEQGIDLQIGFWIGLFAPAGTPAPIVTLLEREIGKAVQQADVAKNMSQLGLEPAASTSAEFTRQIAAEAQSWMALARQKQIKAD